MHEVGRGVYKTVSVYAIWASMGIVLIAIIGMVFYKEPVSVVRIISILLIIAGIFGLELF
jgi:small multidrug resistance pump